MIKNILMFYVKFVALTFIYLAGIRECNNEAAKFFEFDNRIFNGKRANDYEFPYQVSLQKFNKHHCGGSIISEVKVLTAGHCVTDDDGHPLRNKALRILAGTNYLNNKDPLNYYSVKGISIHPKYDRTIIQYDYAVVFIQGQFNLNSKNIKIISLATQEPLPGTVCYLSGWGDVDKSSDTKVPNELQFARITIDPSEVCSISFGNIFNAAHMLCAGRFNNENAGCGDSGSGLVCNSALSGIVSFGSAYYDSQSPDVYCSVFHVSDWIKTAEQSNGSPRQMVGGFASTIVKFIVPLMTQIMLTNKII